MAQRLNKEQRTNRCMHAAESSSSLLPCRSSPVAPHVLLRPATFNLVFMCWPWPSACYPAGFTPWLCPVPRPAPCLVAPCPVCSNDLIPLCCWLPALPGSSPWPLVLPKTVLPNNVLPKIACCPFIPSFTFLTRHQSGKLQSTPSFRK